MKRILITTALMITLSTLGVAIAYGCTCYSNVTASSCSASGDGAECYHDAEGRCVCKSGFKKLGSDIGDDPLPIDPGAY